MWKDFWEWLKPEDRHKRLAVVIAGASFAGFVTVNGTSGIWALFHSADKSSASTTINAPSSPGSVIGPVSGGTVTINNGPSPEQQETDRKAQEVRDAKLDRLLALAEAGGATQRAAAAGIPEAAVRQIVVRLGGEGIDDRDLLPWLNNWIEAAQRELATRPGHEDEAMEAARREAERRFRAGDLDAASAAFMEELSREEQRETVRKQDRNRYRLRLLEKAVDFDKLAFNGEAAVRKFRRMAEIEGVSGPEAVGKWLRTKGDEYYELGLRRGDNGALLIALASFQAAQVEISQERIPKGWAAIQLDLGLALEILGERDNGIRRLEQAIATYRDTLPSYPLGDAPFQRAVTQNNLGRALQTLAEKEFNPGIARQAIAAYEEALAVFTKDKATYYIDGTTRNLTLARALLARLETPR